LLPSPIREVLFSFLPLLHQSNNYFAKVGIFFGKFSCILLEKVTIMDVAAEGKAIAKVNDLVIFVPYVVPGDEKKNTKFFFLSCHFYTSLIITLQK